VLALIIAAIIFFKKPLSVHHAAFITVAVLFVVVFGALHYFPQLRHGT
jgi:K+-transporting ATPase A subunit